MANPQKENGYIPIANEIAEKLARHRISGQEYQVLWVVLRKTWGWNKKDDKISLSQITKMTEMKRSQVCRCLAKLVSKRILSSPQKDTSYIRIYRFNKDYDEWVASPQRDTPSPQKDTGVVPKRGTKLVPKRIHTKDNNTITKETTAEASSARPFSLEVAIKEMEESSRRDINIIAMYFFERKPDIQNKEQLMVAIKRHLRTAGQLKAFSDTQILDAVPKAKKMTEEWTLETIIKVLTK